ncbi:MAG: ThiF family adenylyltransferase [Bdellovibrionales bacterium]|nr:ThiF family adenylyltransferase [Bdellovibrionales bacterium]
MKKVLVLLITTQIYLFVHSPFAGAETDSTNPKCSEELNNELWPGKEQVSPWNNDQESPLRWGRFRQDQLSVFHKLRIGIVGLGAIGNSISQLASMLEIGHFKIADFDTFEVHNRSRQIFAKEGHFGQEKVQIVANEIKRVNPNAVIKSYPKGLTNQNIDDFLGDIDIIIDGIDIFAMKIRRQLFNRAIERGIPIVTVAPLGMTIASAYFAPEGMSFDEYFNVNDMTNENELMLHFLVGMAPKLLHKNDYIKDDLRLFEKKATTDPRAIFAASVELANWIERIFVSKNSYGFKSIPYTTQIDLKTWKKHSSYLRFGLKSPWQKLKIQIVRPQLFQVLSKKSNQENQ